jgi:hypothetical protein
VVVIVVTNASAVVNLQRLFMKFLPQHRTRYQKAHLVIVDPCHFERLQSSERSL